MTLQGRIRARAGAIAEVSSQAWSVVDTLFTPAEFGGSRHGVLVSCRIGEVLWTNPNLTQGTMQVALAEVLADGSIGRVSGQEFAEVRVGDTRLQRDQTPGQGLPVVFCLVVDTSAPHPTFGSSWAASRGLALVARCVTNGDPVIAPFRVSDWLAVAFNAASLGTGKFAAEAYQPSQPQTLNPPPTPRTFTLGSTVLPSSTGSWAVFWGAQHRCYASPAAPALSVYTVANASGGTQTKIAELGMNGRPAGVGTQQLCTLALGGFRVVSPPPDGSTTIACKGVDAYQAGVLGNPVGQSQLARFCWFAVRVSDLYQPLWGQEGTSPSVATIAANADDLSVFFPYEPLFVLPSNYVFLVSASLQPIVQGNMPRGYLPHVFGSNRAPTFERDRLAPQWAGNDERIPIVFGGTYGAGVGAPSDARLEIALLSGTGALPQYPNARARSWFATYLSFGFEDQPSNYPAPAVLPGSITRLIPGRESLAAGSLDVLPRHPDASYVEVVDQPEVGVRGETGHLSSRPRHTRGGRTVSATWSGMTRAEALALYEFLRSRRVISWAPRSETSSAWLISGRPTMHPSGDLFRVAATLSQLIWTGP